MGFKMKRSALILAGLLGIVPAFGEGELGTQAYSWSNLSNLAPSPTTYSLAQYQGKVVLQVVFQYNCGGCVANSSRIGRLVDTLEKSAQGPKFQAVGTEISTATYANIQTYRNSLTNSNTLTLDMPLVKVPHDTAIAATDGVGEKWKRFNSYRDNYFVINHLGIITYRLAGNRVSSMPDSNYAKLRAALNNALNNAPSSLAPGAGSSAGFHADRVGRGYRFRLNGAVTGEVSLRILDLQGRAIRAFTLTSAVPEALWNGTDASGNAMPYGLYFARTEGGGQALSRRLPLLP